MLVEFAIALQLGLAELGLRFVPGERRFGLRQGREKGTLVQRDQQVALVNQLPLAVMHFLDDTRDLRLYGDGFKCLARTDGA